MVANIFSSDAPEQVRAALVQPMTLRRIPGYLLVMSFSRGKLRFIADYKDHDPRLLIENAIALEDQFRYHMLYTTIKRVDKMTDVFFINLYREFKERVPWVRISPAPYADDFNHGLNLFAMMMYNGAFEDPPHESDLYPQLRIEAENEPDETFYAFHALRYIIGGLAVRANIDPDSVAQSREEWLKTKEAVNLTGMSLAAHKLIQQVRKEQKENLERRRHHDEAY